MEAPPPPVASLVQRIWGESVLALLAGRDAPRLDCDPMERLERRAEEGDADAALLLGARRALDALPRRIEAALAFERADVVLADGSAMSLDDTERLLAQKEDRRAHPALRAILDGARGKFRRFHTYGNEVVAPDARQALSKFLVDTRAARDAARDALATLGGESLESPAALARALDLPDGEGSFGEAATLALLGTARDAARPAGKVGRFRAPRMLAGVVVVLDRSDVRFAQPTTLLRFDRHRRTVEAGAVALAASHGWALELGLAMSLGLSSAALRRTAGASRSTAERTARAAAAIGLLVARAEAALVVGGGDARDVLAEALGVDPGSALVDELGVQGWSLVDDRGSAALARVRAASMALVLRDAWDVTFPVVEDAWHEAPEMKTPTEASGWLQWAGELL